VVPFWALQAAELLAMVALVDLSLHVTNGGLLVAAGGLFGLLALVADGPLGIFRVCGRKLHVVLVIASSVVVALAPIVPTVRPDIEGIITIVVVAVGLLRLATITSTRAPAARPATGTTGTTGTAVGSPHPVRPPTGRIPEAARQAGRTTAAASAAVSILTTEHRPAAEAQVRRVLRGAGRLAGRMTADTPSAEHPVDGPDRTS
jgi:hypothetical protein